MARRIGAGERLVVASHNPGKVVEIEALLKPFGVATVGAAALGLPEPEETGATFEENAALKAREAAERSGLPALSDDSGLVVPALGGAPGIYSARWAGPGKDFRAAMERVRRELEPDIGDRTEAPISWRCWHWRGRTARSRHSAARSMAGWSGRRAASGVSATTRYSSPTGTT